MLSQSVFSERLQRDDLQRGFVAGLQGDRRGDPVNECFFPS